MLADIYDGNIWQKFPDYNNEPFLKSPLTYGVMLKIARKIEKIPVKLLMNN